MMGYMTRFGHRDCSITIEKLYDRLFMPFGNPNQLLGCHIKRIFKLYNMSYNNF